MTGKTVVTQETVRELAERMMQRYARGLVSVDELEDRLRRAWRELRPVDDAPAEITLETLARGLCIQVLCEACQLPAGRRRDLAFELLSEYLEQALGDIGGTTRYTAREVREEIVQQALCEILQSLRNERSRPEQPLAFLGWARVILRRQLTLYWRKQPPQEELSLEGQDEQWSAEYVDVNAPDPLSVVLRRERRAELQAAIARLRNPHYRAVLLTIYFQEREVRQVAELLHAQPPDIHLWHHRALHALHKQLTRGGWPQP
ncbi:MAG TPA: sigma-70 family RNA polymerase sigma factor [Ktedonobacteraceae bacterium]